MKNIIFENEKFSIVYNKINANDLWRVEATNAHPAINMNLKFIKNKILFLVLVFIQFRIPTFVMAKELFTLGSFREKRKGKEIN